jgi:hypothetical protein
MEKVNLSGEYMVYMTQIGEMFAQLVKAKPEEDMMLHLAVAQFAGLMVCVMREQKMIDAEWRAWLESVTGAITYSVTETMHKYDAREQQESAPGHDSV